MPFLPEQERALAYARKRGTDASVSDIRTRLIATFSEFETLAAAVPAEIVREHRSTSGWCVQEVVDHLVLSDRPAAQQLARLFEGHDVDEPVPASLQSASPHAIEWQALLHQFRAVHEQVIDVLARATDDTPLGATAVVRMVVTCAGVNGQLQTVTWDHRFDWKAYAILLHAHSRGHISQVQRILSSPSDGSLRPQFP